MKTLVTYASKHGSTTEVAQAIGEVLGAEVLPVGEVATPVDYGAVVIGSPIYSGEWLEEASSFVLDHRQTLAAMPVAMFVLALRLRDDSPENRDSVQQIIGSLKVWVKPVSIGLFAGALDYSKLSMLTRLQVESKGLPEGDFRDMAAVRAWAASLKQDLVPA